AKSVRCRTRKDHITFGVVAAISQKGWNRRFPRRGGTGDFPEGVVAAISQKGWNRRFPRRGGRGDFPEGVEPAILDGAPASERGGKGDSSRRVPGPNPKTEIPAPLMRPQRSSPDNFYCARSQLPSRYPTENEPTTFGVDHAGGRPPRHPRVPLE